jgi:hypothetical protein
MSDYRNSVYDSDASPVGKAVTVAALGGIGFGAFKAIKNKDDFNIQAKKAFNYVFPVNTAQSTPYEKSIQTFNDVVTKTGKARMNNYVDEQAHRARREVMTYDKDLAKDFRDSLTPEKHANTHYAKTNVAENPDIITDIHGNSLKERIDKMVEDLKVKTHASSHEWNGTTVTLNMPGGKTQDLSFSAFDKETQAFVSRKGTASFVTPAKMRTHLGKNNKLSSIEMMDPNTAKLDMLENISVMDAYAAANPALKTQLEKDAALIKKGQRSAAFDKVLSEVPFEAKLSAAHEQFVGDEKRWISPGATDMTEAYGRQVSLDEYSAKQLEEHMPGATGGFIGTKSANPDGIHNQKIQGENRQKFLQFVNDEATPKLVQRGGKLIPISSIPSLQRYNTLTSTGSSSQVATNVMNAGEVKGIPTVERYKSASGMRFKNGNADGTRDVTSFISHNVKESFFMNKDMDVSLTVPITDSFDVPIRRGMFDGDELYEKTKVRLNESPSQKKVRTEAMNQEIHASNTRFDQEIESLKGDYTANATRADREEFDFLQSGIRREKKLAAIEIRRNNRAKRTTYMDQVISGDPDVVKHFEGGGSISWRKGAVFGLETETLPVREGTSTIGLDNVGQVKKARGKGTMNHEQWKESQEAIRQSKIVQARNPDGKFPGYQLPSTMTSDATKFIVADDKVRSAAAFFDPAGGGEGARISELYKKATGRSDVTVESIAGAELFAKHHPVISQSLLNGEASSLIQKSGDTHLLAMQQRISGLVDVFSNGLTTKLTGSDSFTKAWNRITEGGSHIDANRALDNTMEFISASTDTGTLTSQLMDTQQVLGTLTEALWNNESKDINLGLMSLKDSSDVVTQLVSGNQTGSYTKPVNSESLNARRQLDPMRMKMRGAEVEQLAQGAGQTNAMRVSMRDISVFQNRPGFAREILERSTTDTVLQAKQQQLFKVSLAGDAEETKRLADDLISYASNSGYGQHKIDDFKRQMSGDFQLEQVSDDIAQFAGGKQFGIDMSGMKSEVGASQSFLSEKNDLGKMFLKEDGKLGFIPGRVLNGGLTRLDNGQMVADEAAHIVHQRMIMPLIQHGSISQEHELALRDRLPELIEKHTLFSKAVVEDAYYPKHVALDGGAINDNAFLKKLQGQYEKGYIDPSVAKLTESEASFRSTLSNTTIVSQEIMEDSVKKKLTLALEKKGRLGLSDVSGVLAEDGQSRFFKKYEKELSQLDAINEATSVAERASKINDITRKIVDDQIDLSQSVHDLQFGKGDVQSLSSLSGQAQKDRMAEIANKIEENGLTGMFGRNPVIYTTSISGQNVVVDRSKGKNKLLRGKSIAGGYDIPHLLKTDWDGDKHQAFLSFADDFARDTKSSIAGVQETGIKHFIQSKNNYLATMGVDINSAKNIEEIYGFRDIKDAHGFAEAAIKDMPMLTALAATVQHGMTGAVDIKQFGMQAHLEEKISKANLKGQDLIEATTWAHSIPSYITEQELISSKHIQELFNQKIKGKNISGVEAMFGIIGDITPTEMESAITKSKGIVPVLGLFAGAGAYGTEGHQERWAGTNEFMNDLTSVKHGLYGIDDKQRLQKVYAATGHSSTYDALTPDLRKEVDEQVAGYTSRLNTARELAKNGDESYLPIADRSYMKDVTDGKMVGLAHSGSSYNTSQHAGSISADALKAAESKLGTKVDFGNSEHAAEYIQQMTNRAYSTEPYAHVRGLMADPLSEGMIPKASRSIRGWDKLKEAIKPAKEWIAEAPMHRIGGLAALATAGVAALNLFSGDGTPQSPNELPRYNNPTFDGNNFHKAPSYGMMNSMMRSNNSNSLLSDNTMSLSDSISSINSHVNLNGHNAISVREDRSNPYMSTMHDTFNH